MKQTTTSVLHFKGKLTFERIGILLNDLKNSKEAFNIHPVLYKKLLTLMIEVLENVLKYKDYFDDYAAANPQYLPEFELKLTDRGFVLKASNPVLKKDRTIITRKINQINSSSKEQLRKIYRDTITNGMFTDKGGAGLGFIEMAKVADKDLEFNFHPATGDYLIYEIILHINHIDQFNHG